MTIRIKSRIPVFLDRKLQCKGLPMGSTGQWQRWDQSSGNPGSATVPSTSAFVQGDAPGVLPYFLPELFAMLCTTFLALANFITTNAI